MQALVPTYLEFTMTRFADEQTKMREQIVSKALGGDMFGALHDQTRANMQVFQDAFRLFNPFAVTQRGTAEKPAEPETDIDNLKREIEAMRQRLDKMGSR
jgi:polyhydroxyalkanoate synthesis regulator protein